MTHFWNNLHQVPSKVKSLESQINKKKKKKFLPINLIITLAALITRRGFTFIDVRLAIISRYTRNTITCIAVKFVCTIPIVLARRRLTFINICLTISSCYTRNTVTYISVNLICAIAIVLARVR